MARPYAPDPWVLPHSVLDVLDAARSVGPRHEPSQVPLPDADACSAPARPSVTSGLPVGPHDESGPIAHILALEIGEVMGHCT